MNAATESVALLTGFKPFGGEKINPSGRLALSLDGRLVKTSRGRPVRVRSVLLPVTWDGAFHPLAAVLKEPESRPAAVVMLGQAGGITAVAVERVAVNACSGTDTEGAERQDVEAVPGGPPAYFSTLPLRATVRRIESLGLPACISNSAGTYLCNYVFYRLMHHLEGRPDPPPAGFIHVPFVPEQAVGKKPIPPSMAEADIERAVLAALRAALETEDPA